MLWLRRSLARLTALWRKPALEDEMDEELRFHLAMRAAENVGRGMTESEALRQATLRFGNLETIKETCRDIIGGGWMERRARDFSLARRRILQDQGFTLVVVIAMALALASFLTTWSVYQTVLARPLPYPDAEELVRIGGSNGAEPSRASNLSPPDFNDWRARNQVFTQMAAIEGWAPTVLAGEDPEAVPGARVSPEFFDVLQQSPAHGRAFHADEGNPGRDHVIILSYRFAERLFGRGELAIGQEISIDGQPYSVVGVMPAAFKFPEFSEARLAPPQLWAPFAPDVLQWPRSRQSVEAGIARLKKGVTLEEAQREMRAIGHQLHLEHPAATSDYGVAVEPLREQLVESFRPGLLLVLLGGCALFVISCANVSALLLARSLNRRQEFAVRFALGASRWRVIAQLMTEALLLAAAAAILAVPCTFLGAKLVGLSAKKFIPRLDELSLSGNDLMLGAALIGFVLLLLGLVPLFVLPQAGLRPASARMKRARRPQFLSRIFLLGQIALLTPLLAAAAFSTRTFIGLTRTDPGFSARDILGTSIFLPSAKYPSAESQIRFFSEIERELQGGEAPFAGVRNLPLSGGFDRISVYFEGRRVRSRADVPELERYVVTPGYFETMGIPLRRGRLFTSADDGASPLVVVIGEETARRFWPGQNSVGKRMRLGAPEQASRPWWTVVGVVGSVRHYGLEKLPAADVYLPLAQHGAAEMVLLLAGKKPVEEKMAALRFAVEKADPEQPLHRPFTLGRLVSDSLAQKRLVMAMLAAFATLASFLVLVGIYGLVSYSVMQRRHELGIRLALGAERGQLMRMVLGNALRICLIGVGIGVILSFLFASGLGGYVSIVPAEGILVFVLAGGMICLIALGAAYFPARRALHFDPLLALRCE